MRPTRNHRLGCLAAAAIFGFTITACGGQSDQSSAIASKIGATSCTAENYEIVSHLDNSRERIYDCTLNGNVICVVEANGIASNVTEEARLLFANALGVDKPECLS